ILISSVRHSRRAATQGSAALWLLACSGATLRLGQLGAVDVLALSLSEAVLDKDIAGLYAEQARASPRSTLMRPTVAANRGATRQTLSHACDRSAATATARAVTKMTKPGELPPVLLPI
ncbi:MAG: hypothetical protein SGPRY_015019, partial [Prymnesium sp.]